MPDTAGEHGGADVAEYQEFLCFRVSDEVYGINIMEIKELIRPREVTEVPRAPSFVSGVISLRGTIIPIIDMLDRLGLPRETVTGRERVIVVRSAESYSGLLVDEIIQVVRIDADCMESAPTVLDGIDRDFVTGIGRSDGRMIIILNVANITDIHLY
jgi:purine-binding chemotaxis protein CheW